MWQVVLLVVLIIVWYLYNARISKTQRITVNGQGVLITGCDTGIGHDLAKRLDKMGFHVFAGCLVGDGPGAAELARSCSKRLHVVQLDVTKDDQIRSAKSYVETIHKQTGCGLWAVVNNAGIDCWGDIEFCTMDMYRRIAEVNLFGMINVTKIFLPMIRKSKGRIVNNTSVKGRVSLPRISVYGITKYGGENFSDCLRLEMRKFGVKVVIVEPGEFGGVTGILKGPNLKRLKKDVDEMWNNADTEVRQAYGRKYLESQFSGLEKSPDPSYSTINPVIDAFVDAVTLENPKSRYLVDGGKGLIDYYCFYARLNSYLPTAWMDFLVDRWFNSFGVSNFGT
ncbi:D-beta-hydroxybutyrate dehydrogenase, mitochondrial-like [Saccostrea echinata]|uniref:D-beta-hydroxybutyrate dehydrogenase, mitochondrial-like n=1 Tax=Saccostrea echinata TaxID=191078 RepID=UPI002A810076|nr:D-beta-hydroxybutyrate dehydrogenase, mitochondrial-like [Saccostrea echinata]